MELHYENSALVDGSAVRERARELSPYITHLKKTAALNNYSSKEASINLPFDTRLEETVKNAVSEINSHELRYIVNIGIGGSNLGTLALYEARRGKLGPYVEEWPKMLFLDTNNPVSMREIIGVLNLGISKPDEIAVNVISKSGSTTETISNFEVLYGYLAKRFGKKIDRRIVVTTDEGSKLWDAAGEKNFLRLLIPKNVGGRYSVFSSVGMFPLELAGLDTNEIREGAATMRDKCLSVSAGDNPALVSAILLFESQKKGFVINNNFFFNSGLEFIGKWYRQLMGESIGKEKDAEGNIVHAGIIPTVAVGSTDLHSMAQLYLGGPRNIFTTFVYAKGYGKGVKVPGETALGGLVGGIEGKDFTDIMSAIYGGVTRAYRSARIPFMEVFLGDISEFSLAQFLQMKMMEIMYLAKLMGLNAFDQPSVENYKKETRKLLLG